MAVISIQGLLGVFRSQFRQGVKARPLTENSIHDADGAMDLQYSAALCCASYRADRSPDLVLRCCNIDCTNPSKAISKFWQGAPGSVKRMPLPQWRKTRPAELACEIKHSIHDYW